jgi:hypothetical protein
MIAKFRGGPMNRKTAQVPDGTSMWEVAGTAGRTFDNYNTFAPLAIRRGRYSSTVHPFKNGAYPFVWLGWNESTEY